MALPNFGMKSQQPLVRWILLLMIHVVLLTILFFPAISENAAMQWDAAEIYLPWKYFLTDQVRHGFLPLWNPYMSGGFPQHGDPGSWYELSYLFAMGKPYDLQSLLYEYLFHLIIASLGFGYFLRGFNTSWWLSSTLGIVYSLNGFFMGNAQHLGWVVGFAWLPWLLGLCLRILFISRTKQPFVSTSLFLGVVAHLQFVGGYLGVTALSLYCALGMWLVWLSKSAENRAKQQVLKQAAAFGISLLVFVLLSLPALLSFWDLQSLITRSSTLSLGDLQFGHWPWKALVTMCYVEADAALAQSLLADISLINVRWSFLLLLSVSVFVLVNGFIRLRRLTPSKVLNKKTLIALMLAVVCFFLAVGPETSLHGFLIPKLPLLKLFRFPALYRGMGLFLLLMVAAMILNGTEEKWVNRKGLLLIVLLLESVLGAYRDIPNTVLVPIPAHEVNSMLINLQNKGNSTGKWSNQIPLALAVDQDSSMNALIPFMNQNQGIYLKQWATDGYNPYQLRSREMDTANEFDKDHLPIAALDEGNRMIEKGVVRVEGIKENGQSIAFRGVHCSANTHSLLVKQTPSRHWKLMIEGREVPWKSFGQRGIQIPRCNSFELVYAPNYLSKLVLGSSALTWFLLLSLLIINRIAFFRKLSLKNH